MLFTIPQVCIEICHSLAMSLDIPLQTKSINQTSNIMLYYFINVTITPVEADFIKLHSRKFIILNNIHNIDSHVL